MLVQVPAGLTRDPDGGPRIADGSVDIGAYEWWRLQMAAISATDASLSWGTAGSGCSYDVYEETAPYVSPAGDATYTGVTSGTVVVNRLGDPGSNYFFVLRATCNGGVYQSNEVGAFDFALAAGG